MRGRTGWPIANKKCHAHGRVALLRDRDRTDHAYGRVALLRDRGRTDRTDARERVPPG